MTAPTGQAGAQAAVQAESRARDCGYGEHLLVWSWRRIAGGKVHCPVMEKEFCDACGQNAREVFLALCAFLSALTSASRRPLALSAPDPFSVTPDERQILTLIAAAQAENDVLVQAHLRWIAQPTRRHELQFAAFVLAKAFRTNNLPLAVPRGER
jgi:hypothetical protein